MLNLNIHSFFFYFFLEKLEFNLRFNTDAFVPSEKEGGNEDTKSKHKETVREVSDFLQTHGLNALVNIILKLNMRIYICS